MVAITFIEPDANVRRVDVEPGMSLKDAAIRHSINGIVGLCGGYANCGTCHVYVAEADVDRLPQPEEAEEMMLDGVSEDRLATSRLACQIIIDGDLEGLTVRVPDSQM